MPRSPTNRAHHPQEHHLPAKQRYECQTCGAELSRLAHLHRHQLQHSSPAQTFQCQLCDKQFNRKDVYQRHVRAVHDPLHTSQKKGWKKSCQRCIRNKLKCSREHPCTSCQRKRAVCIYDTPPVRPASQTQSGAQTEQVFTAPTPSDSQWTGPSEQSMSLGPAQDISNPATYPGDNETSNLALASQPAEINSPHTSYDGKQAHSIQAEGHQNIISYSSPGLASAHNPQASSPNADFRNAMMLLGQETRASFGNGPGGCEWMDNISLDLDPFDSSMLRASRIDWLGCEAYFSDQHTISPLSGSELQAEGGEAIACRDSTFADTMMERPVSAGVLASSHPSGVSLSIGRDERASWPAVLDRGGNEMWPFDYASNKGFRKIQLPPLRDILEQTVGHLPAIQNSTVKDLIKVLSAPLIPSLNDSPALEALPAVSFLGQLIKIYFAEFHPVLPIVHVPTWRIEKCPTVLLAAMACIGATYSDAEGSQEVAALLAEITQRTLFWLGQADSRSYRNPFYIAATCLHQIYALGSGNRRLYELADASRGLLVTGLRELGALSMENEVKEGDHIDFASLKKMNRQELDNTWYKWRDIEFERRVAWSVFEFDCTLATLTGKRGAFSISELPRKLPCSDNLWDAPSANAWATVVPFSVSPPGGIAFYPSIRSIVAGKNVSESVPVWAKRICVLVIGRLLWDLRELADISSGDIMGLPSLTDSHQASRRSLLTCLTNLDDSLSRPTCNYDVINMNIACLATHFSHLTNDETMDMVTFIFRHSYSWNNGTCSPSLYKELSRAREHLRYRFTNHPVSTRRAVFHAAKVIGVSRECTSFTPCETMRVFFSFAFILAFATFSPPKQSQRTTNQFPLEPPVRLDDLPIRYSGSTDSVDRHERWIEHGGPASLETVDDITDIRQLEFLKQAALRSMERLRVWGIAKKFQRIFKNFNYE